MLTIYWHDKAAKGYKDMLPTDWFIKEGVFHSMTHQVLGPKSGGYKAKCDLQIKGASVVLDYERYARFNEAHGMELGVLMLQFKTAERKVVSKVYWKNNNDQVFKREATTVVYEEPDLIKLPDIDFQMTSEGRGRFVVHLIRERNAKLVEVKKKSILSSTGKLACEVCGFDFKQQYGQIGESFCEVHHRLALSRTWKTQTRLSDLAILCSNCHRIIHRTSPMVSVEKFKQEKLKRAQGNTYLV